MTLCSSDFKSGPRGFRIAVRTRRIVAWKELGELEIVIREN
jgi:hypothetical protein